MDSSEVVHIMASYRIRSADLEAVRQTASMYAQLDTSYRTIFPVENIPRSLTSKWYTLTNIPGPALSVDGADYEGVRTARTEGSNPVIWMRYKFHWTITEVEAAQRAGIPLKADDVRIGLRMIHDKISQMAIEGLDVPDVISGITETGTDLGATLDTTYVATADAFITHVITGANHLLTNGFRGPYHMVVSDAIARYLELPLGSGGGMSQKQYCEQVMTDLGGTPGKIFIERGVAAATFAANIEIGLEDNCYPMVYAADDGIWTMTAANLENMAIQEVGPPSVDISGELNRETNTYEGFINWQGTLRTTHAASTGFMEDVDHTV